MSDPRQRHGTHTWDLVLHYYRCPHCGYILENREKYERDFHSLYKNLQCARCQKPFKVTKKPKTSFGPLLGHDPEVNA